jgi:hypothetical protein
MRLNNRGLHFRQDATDAFINNMNGFVTNGQTGNGQLIITGQQGTQLRVGNVGANGTLVAWLTDTFQLGIAGSTSGTFVGDPHSIEMFITGSPDENDILYVHNINAGMNHGMTANGFSTDGVLKIDLISGTQGGVDIFGASEQTIAIEVTGMAQTNSTNTSPVAQGGFSLRGQLADGGGGVQNYAVTGNVGVIRNNAVTIAIFKGDGDLVIDGTQSSFDDEQDAIACQDLAYAMAGEWDKVLRYHAPELERIGVMTNGFVSTKKFWALSLGAIGELHHMVSFLLNKSGTDYETLRRQIRSGEVRFIPAPKES